MTLTVPRVGRLVSRVEIAEMLGMSKQRLHQIMKEGGFPEPVEELGIGRIWDRDVIKRWARETGRLPFDDDDE